MRGLLTIAQLTFEEARRKRLLSAALVLGAAFLAVFGLGAYLINQDLIGHGVSEARRRGRRRGCP